MFYVVFSQQINQLKWKDELEQHGESRGWINIGNKLNLVLPEWAQSGPGTVANNYQAPDSLTMSL